MNRLAVLFGVPFLPLTACAQLRDGACNVYAGTLGASTETGMRLYSNDKTVQGSYFYRKCLKDIPLKGTETGAGTFFRDGKRVSVKNSAEFLKNYDTIFSKAFVAKIAGGVPHHMFANAEGIMIADGAVWFDRNGRARNFNNSTAS